ncbi:VanZ family protein [Caldicellulosiruptor kronotskyensis 2002]|uniref:VanZ family protein n=1 Tax=Caldicellulosiruptor kronotskyensis (strain DSM 18902 / VKM B-2412 / 2002) TaxID=632348 RepID=E4SHD6_CALK2|nr:VanZ family protein [Caldicellulosiruptor kronotskyensis]ADQ47161.1 VanZ family protein [Caldicellulosiruptor kronotskyensis 2002]
MKSRIYIRWALVFVWMTVIFCFSAQEGAISHQKSFSIAIFAEKFIEFFTGKDLINSHNRKNFELFIRKLAHVTEYFILSMLFYKAFFECNRNSKKSFILTFIFSVAYAISDEVHQIFVSGRGPSAVDVMIDTIGIISYLLIKRTKNMIKNSLKFCFK